MLSTARGGFTVARAISYFYPAKIGMSFGNTTKLEQYGELQREVNLTPSPRKIFI